MTSERSSWQRRTRFTRRRFGQAAGTAGIGVAAYALTGCGDDDDDSPATATVATGGTTTTGSATAAASETPKKGGDLAFGLGAPTNQSLDPHRTVNLGFSYYGIILNRMIRPDPKAIAPYQGELVQSWEQVDKTTFTFKVRPGVTWHDGKVGGGRAVTAEDIAFNLMRIAGKTDPARAAAYQRSTNLSGMDSATAVDATTVKISFTAPNSAFIAGVADWRNWVINKEQVDKDPEFRDIKNLAGTGPYMVESWSDTTITGKYVPNPKFWKPGQPYANSIEQFSLSDTAASQAAFLSGKLDFIAAGSAEVRSEMAKRAGAKIVTYPNLRWDYFGYNQNRPGFSDPRVRVALTKLVDFTSLMDQEYKQGSWTPTSVLLAGLPGAPSSEEAGKTSPWNPATKQQDQTEAKAALTAAGFPDGKGLTFKILPTSGTGTYFNHSVRLQEQLQKALPQIKVDLAPPADGAAFARDLSAGSYDVVLYTAAPPPDAIFDPAQRLKTGGARNYTKFSDPQTDTLIDSIFVEFDTAARARLLGQLRARIQETILNVPLGSPAEAAAVQGRIRGFEGALGVGSSLSSYEWVQGAERIWIA